MNLKKVLALTPLEIVASLLLASFIFAPFIVSAQDTGSVTATVTVQNISVSVSDGSVSYGTVAPSGTQDTTSGGVDDTQTATNDGNVTEDFNIKGADSTNWTIGGTAGADQYVHEYCITTCDSTPTWNALSTTYETLTTGVATSGTQDVDLQFTAPSSTATTSQESLTVTVQAVAN